MNAVPLLQFISYQPWETDCRGNGEVIMTIRENVQQIAGLPQIYWSSGEGWAEANLWALNKMEDGKTHPDTVKSLMKHLHAYAVYLEANKLDWRHFPISKADRALVRFRGQLVKDRDLGVLSSSTVTARMRAVIQFYRYADKEGFVDRRMPLWIEKSVVLPFYDAVGFKRTLVRVTTDLNIPNRRRVDDALEDGLMPLKMEDMQEILKLTQREGWEDLYLMLSTGAFTGARLGTITTLRVHDLERAIPDPRCKGIHRIQVGPGTGVKTKLNISGEILFPDGLLESLKAHAYSIHRLKREAKARPEHKSSLFLTVRGKPYTPHTVDRLMVELRRIGARKGLHFLRNFKFHQTRATFGTWLMELCLEVTTPSAAIAFCKEALLHKNEATTFRYIKFINKTKGKIEMSERFSEAFTGVTERNWDKYDA